MKIRYLFSLLTISSLTITTTLLPQQKAQAQNVDFFCGKNGGNPATIADHPRYGDVPIIRWSTQYFSKSKFTPQRRCELVSRRFQRAHDQGNLDYLTTSRRNNLPVICSAGSEGGPCSKVLFTLRPQDNPQLVLQQLMDIRNRASESPILHQSRPYIDMEQYIKQRAAQDDGVSPTKSSEPAQQRVW